MKTVCFVTFICILLAACGIARRQEMQARIAELDAQTIAAMQACNDSLPAGNPKTAVARAKCQVDAIVIRRPIVTHPDLMDLFIAKRMVVAEDVQNGKLTVAQANVIIANLHSEWVTEEQRRNLANRSVAAQEGMAAASMSAAGPHSCTRFGNTVTCY
jgi:hypothetical protein